MSVLLGRSQSVPHESYHDSCKPMNQLEKQRVQRDATDLGKALFYAIKHQDFTHAQNLIDMGAPLDRCYEVERDVYRTTISILVAVICHARLSHGHKVLAYKIPDSILNTFIKTGVDMRCHCSNKFEHRCPLFVAFKILKVKNEQELFQDKNKILQKLIQNGATIKQHLSPHKTSAQIPYFDIEGIRSYLVTKTELEDQKKSLIQTASTNFHENNQNPLPTKHQSQLSKSGYEFTFKYK